ncbi:hypothetical protein M885DRAFT_98199 [Pelagophyceae sp. CCMP2097]|nr:hypothetical protein M885DRAFT_98199 [Pelagophyceae sp. CCMP2097]
MSAVSAKRAVTTPPRTVCVIGAGAGGLVAAAEMRAAGLAVRVYEKADTVGGIWRNGGAVAYAGLRTNLPHQIMAYKDYPFQARRSFVTTSDVTDYLEAYAQDQNLLGLVELRREVLTCTPGDGGWVVRSRVAGCDAVEERFDCVVVANGHYETPARATFDGSADFPGAIEHSVDYDTPTKYTGQVVLCVGAKSSGTDIAKELVDGGARKVLVADSSCGQREVYPGNDALVRVPFVASLGGDGSVTFGDGSKEPKVDTVIECVGFEYNFPFFAPEVISARGRAVEPLWEHAFHTEHADSLVFLGVPHSVVPFPLMQVQAILAAAVFSLRVRLPPVDERRASEAAHFALLKRRRDAHFFGDKQWTYCEHLIELAEVEKDEAARWRALIEANRGVYDHVKTKRPAFPGAPDDYRNLEYTVDRDASMWKCLNEDAVPITS